MSSRHLSGATGATRPRPAVDASMGLLNDLMSGPLEAGYAEAARQRGVVLPPGVRARRRALSLVMALVLGLVTTSAVLSLRAPQEAVQQSRTLLADEIAERSAEADELARANEALSADIAALQSDALEEANPRLFERLQEAELLSGAVGVTGPGLVLELDDAVSPDGLEVEDASRVQDLDLQMVTNALWASGAEAIAINGQRLTSLSAIRSAGQAILVDLAPLVAPYRVEAVGDVQAMQTAFARSGAARRLSTLTGTYGIQVSTRAAQDLQLPGATTSTLLYATPPGGMASSAPTEGEEGP